MDHKVFIIAEVGSVHDGSLGNAKKLIDAAAQCGADAVKFQTHIASAETIRDAPMPGFFTGEPRFEYFERTGFGLEQWCELKARCQERGVEFISAPFSNEAVELLEAVGVERYKVPSGEVTNLPLLEALARTGKPILLSSGMSSWPELDQAVQTIRQHHERLVVMQCTTEYPCPYEQVGLNVLGRDARALRPAGGTLRPHPDRLRLPGRRHLGRRGHRAPLHLQPPDVRLRRRPFPGAGRIRRPGQAASGPPRPCWPARWTSPTRPASAR